MTMFNVGVYNHVHHGFLLQGITAIPEGKRTDKTTFIYKLVDQRGATRYVGKTVMSLRHRKKCHIKQSKKNPKYHVNLWIRTMLELGLEPDIIILEVVPPFGEWWIAEADWIERHLLYGCQLTNQTAGGDGPGRFSMETIEKMSKIHKGRPPPENARIGNQAYFAERREQGLPGHLKGRRQSEAHVKKLVELRTGKKHSAEWSKAISDGLRRFHDDPNHVRKSISEETRAKLSAKAKDRPQSQNSRDKRSKTLLAYYAIEENRKKLRIAKFQKSPSSTEPSTTLHSPSNLTKETS